MEHEIIKKYLEADSSLDKICKEYKIGKLKLKTILKNNNIPIKKVGGKVKYTNNKNIIITPHILECKKCSKKFNDYENKSGSITTHIKECYPDVDIPSSFKRRMFFKEHGVHFHNEFFNKIEVIELPQLICPICNWETTDLKNKSGSFTKHIEKEHVSVSDFIEQYPQYINYFNTFKQFEERNELFNDKENYIICNICDEKLKILSNTYLKLHDITVDKYKLLYGDNIISTKLNNIFNQNLINSNNNITYRSKSEIEICSFLDTLGIKYETNTKKILNGTELDIFLPDFNIGIEFNGLYWHSEKQGKTKKYHIDKTIKCLDNKIRLIHIFSDEWESKKEIIKERLKNLTNIKNEKIYARKCTIEQISKIEKKKFLDDNHLQGNDKSSIFYALKYNDKIVSLLTFGNLRRPLGNKNEKLKDYEIYRYCSLNVIGGFTKLLNHFIKEHKPNRIITYADRNWSPSDEYCFYGKVGFNFIGITKPNYYYTKNYIHRYYRFNFRKDVLVKMGHDSNKTENQIMIELGYDKIWDTGNLKYEMVLK